MTVALGSSRRPAALLPAAAGSAALGALGVAAAVWGVSSDRSTVAKVGVVIVGLLIAALGFIGAQGLATNRRRGLSGALAVSTLVAIFATAVFLNDLGAIDGIDAWAQL